MNALEDAFWSARAIHLARLSGGRSGAAVVIRRGKSIAESVADLRHAPELGALFAAGGRARGGTLSLSHLPTPRAAEVARERGITRLVLPHTCVLQGPSLGVWIDASIRVERAPGPDRSQVLDSRARRERRVRAAASA